MDKVRNLVDHDHTTMNTPHLAIWATEEVGRPYIELITWQLRISAPGVGFMDGATVHSLEHILIDLLVGPTPGVTLAAPMGCGTGYYIQTVGLDYADIAGALSRVLNDTLSLEDVPHANPQQCGHWRNHSLKGAQDTARYLLARRARWHMPVIADSAQDRQPVVE